MAEGFSPYERALNTCKLLDSLLESIEADTVKQDFGTDGPRLVMDEVKAQIGELLEVASR